MEKVHNNQNKKKKDKTRISDTLILFIILIILFISFSISNKIFISYENIRSLLNNLVVIGILAIGLTPLMISGGIDLSIGSSISLTSIVIAMSYNSGIPLLVSLFIGIVLAAFIGLINGFFIIKFNLMPLIFTLGMLAILSSIAYVLSDAKTIGVTSDGMFNFAFTTFLKIPKPLIVLIVLAIICWIFMRYSRTGVRIYAIGGNPKVAKLFGIKVNKITIILYLISGLTTGIAAVIAVAISGIGAPFMGRNVLLPTLSAIVLGGIGLTGGSGNVLGTILGVLIINIIFNGLTILNVQSFLIQVIQGFSLIIVVMVYEIRQKKRQLTM